MPTASQLGVKSETTWGTAVVVDRFFEYNSESIEEDHQRIDSQGMRANEHVLHAERFAIGRRSAAGQIQLEVLTKGFGWWLHHMLGTVTTSAVVDSCYTHTGQIAALGTAAGDSFTAQVNRPFNPSQADNAFTFEGGKVTDWEIMCDVDGLLMAQLGVDFEDISAGGTALASASYPSGAEVMSFVGGTVTLAAGTVVKTDRFRVRCNNGLRVDKYSLGDSTKRQQRANAKRVIDWEIELDYEDNAQRARVASATASGALASIVAEFRGPTLAGTATYPSLKVTIANARFDQMRGASVTGEEELMQTLTGVALHPDGDTAVKLEYVSTDSTP